VASTVGLPLKRLAVDEGPSFGAALLALTGIGAFTGPAEAADRVLAIKDEIAPDPALAAVYARAYERFRGLYPALQDRFDAGA
jgi:xylulokinase